ncbi:MAG: ribosome biogenesis GTPase Der [Candidatus Improbicoccus pseudotrichonymphae]|uniref:GTPase Der n=1 Tax=Candidatus Improbicoccus pseudotrichonymphae TaxID=3033792 RepID=A0AA48HVJ9_9FIRM|nr:MAG: ribosome biogenesis GTPase Der [Candidatus Improbicoccus pseudotrichonymphae]
MDSLPRIALVGRTNVGKSTLFNKLTESRKSVVFDSNGVTRDPIESLCYFNKNKILLIDCGGLDYDSSDSMSRMITEAAEKKIESCDVLLMVVDVNSGLLPDDKKIALKLKRISKPVILCANKCDNTKKNLLSYDFFSLGLGEPFPVSSLHGDGIIDLLEKIFSTCERLNLFMDCDDVSYLQEDSINISVIGKPNVGKSSFLNRIFKEDRFIVSDIAGTTRDILDLNVIEKKEDDHVTRYIFADTPGIRRRKKNAGKIEYYGVIRTHNSIESSDICICMIDATEGITSQDIKIIGLTKNYGKACILLINKWDLIENKEFEFIKLKEKIKKYLSFASYLRFVFVSVKTGQNIDKIFNVINDIYKNYSLKISTSVLNNLLGQIVIRVPTPEINRQKLKIYYFLQTGVKPPVFTFFVNKKKLFHFSYQRYIENCLRQSFEFSGVPIKFLIREKNEKIISEKLIRRKISE